ncbi:hypothetical protein BY996DRAFT_6412576 [Phakopsora pachyrhizi]|nr:hypothetical protein BY996DRAFT_6412576 [Phakopsora pachyrhizi]
MLGKTSKGCRFERLRASSVKQRFKLSDTKLRIELLEDSQREVDASSASNKKRSPIRSDVKKASVSKKLRKNNKKFDQQPVQTTAVNIPEVSKSEREIHSYGIANRLIDFNSLIHHLDPNSEDVLNQVLKIESLGQATIVLIGSMRSSIDHLCKTSLEPLGKNKSNNDSSLRIVKILSNIFSSSISPILTKRFHSLSFVIENKVFLKVWLNVIRPMIDRQILTLFEEAVSKIEEISKDLSNHFYHRILKDTKLDTDHLIKLKDCLKTFSLRLMDESRVWSGSLGTSFLITILRRVEELYFVEDINDKTEEVVAESVELLSKIIKSSPFSLDKAPIINGESRAILDIVERLLTDEKLLENKESLGGSASLSIRRSIVDVLEQLWIL